ncbi:MAG: glycosyltransferase family 39 protein [Cyanobacteria bacterium J06560_2]
MVSASRSRQKSLIAALIPGGLLLLVCLRFVHLQADFPLDLGDYGMAYTDEGWWSRNAVAWVRDGSWYIDDGYNTITNLPVVPAVQTLWFKLFGVSLASARAISVVCSLLVSGLVYLLAQRELPRTLAWIAPFVVLSDYPTFAYSRLALLEMPMIALLLLSLWLVTGGRELTFSRTVSSGVLLTLAILAKTTALFALPVVAFSVYLQPGSLKVKIRTVLSWLLVVGVSSAVCYFFLNQAGDASSQAYFADHNVSQKVPKSVFDFLKGPLRVMERSFRLFPLLFPGLMGAIALIYKAPGKSLKTFFKTVTQPHADGPFISELSAIIVLWTGCTLGAFSLSDFAAPRYFLVLIVPIALAVPLTIQTMLRRSAKGVTAGKLLALAFFISTFISLLRVGTYLRAPNFTLITTANTIEEIVTAKGARSNVVMGNFVDTLALAAAGNIKAINDKMGFQALENRLETFNPSYYLSIGPAGTLNKDYVRIKDAIEKRYQLRLLEKFEIYRRRDFDQPVFFYRLAPR